MKMSNKEILQEANKAVERGDNEGFLSFCTEDVTWSFIGDQTLTGKDAVRSYMKAVYQEPPKFNVGQLIAEGDTVAAIGTINLKNENGEMAEYTYCDVWRFREGKMAELKAFVIETGPDC